MNSISRRRFLKTLGFSGAGMVGLSRLRLCRGAASGGSRSRAIASPAGWPRESEAVSIARHRRRARRRPGHAGRAHPRHRRAHQRARRRHHRAARRLRRQPQIQDPPVAPRGMVRGAGRAAGAAGRARHSRQPRLVGRSRRPARAQGPRARPAHARARRHPRLRERRRAPASRTAAASGSPGSATSWRFIRGRASAAWRTFQGVDDLDGTLPRSRTTRP